MDRKLEKCSKPSAVLENPCLKSTMNKLFEKRSKTGDIKFIVDSEEIYAHRCVLAALSPRYEAQFYGDLAEKDSIEVEEISSAAFKEFLQFFYTNEVTLTLENIEDVINLAKQSLVDELVIECINFLMTVIGIDKLLWCHQLALGYELKSLEEFCVKHIGINIENIFQNTDFLSCERDVLCRVLNFNSLNCNETVVFDGCIAWAQAKCERDGIDATDTANLRAALGESLLKIRFCSMKAEEFAAINRKYSGLLTAQESIEVFQTIILKASGEQPSIFDDVNSKMRIPIQPYLQCSIAKGPRIQFKSTKERISFAFLANKAIRLNGFDICNKIDDAIKVDISLFNVINFCVPCIAKSFNYKNTISTSEKETRIIFDDPIEIPANIQCALQIPSNNFKKSNTRFYGFNLESRVTQNGVLFIIPEILCSKSNLITRLLFDIHNEVHSLNDL